VEGRTPARLAASAVVGRAVIFIVDMCVLRFVDIAALEFEAAVVGVPFAALMDRIRGRLPDGTIVERGVPPSVRGRGPGW
jgi:hypothetical protein